MKILYQNLKKGEVKVQVENIDDLWYLSHIMDPGDLIRGKTARKIKFGKETDRKQAIEKRAVTLAIKIEKIEFHKTSNMLRVSGKITEAPEDVPIGTHHTFNLDINSVVKIVKEKWLKFQIDKLKEASITKIPKILVCVLDRENVLFALLKKSDYKILSEFSGDVQKKDIDIKRESNFYSEIIKTLKDYDERYELDYIIIASPAFWKEELVKNVRDENLRKKIVQATCSASGESGLKETLKRQEVSEVLKQDRIAKEMKLVEELLVQIAKNNLAAYGIKETELAAVAGAVDKLLVTDKLIQEYRQEGKFEKLDNIMKTVDKMKGEITVISSEHDGGKKLDGLGGIGAILRYRIK